MFFQLSELELQSVNCTANLAVLRSLLDTFHLSLHCLPKYLFTGIQNEKGQGHCYINFA